VLSIFVIFYLLAKLAVYMKLLAFLLLFFHWHAHSQTAIYPSGGTLYDGKLHKLELIMHADTLAALFHPNNRWTNHSYPAIFIYDEKDTLHNVGVRIKGNTSRNSEKLSLKIDTDEFIKQTYQGLKTFNINGNHNDPSMCREFLSTAIMNEAGIVCIRSNWVKLYINGLYRGVFNQVENINKKFLESRFGNDSGNLYKCSWPAGLDWMGSDPNTYKAIINPSPLNERAYELKTNEKADNYTDLVQLIDVINNTAEQDFPAAIERIFDVQAYLKTQAMEVLIGHWDSYWYNKNNYYLYHDPAKDKFVYIPYDMDNTFGVQWGIKNINIRDINHWGNLSSTKAVLTHRLFKFAQYRRDYEQYIFDMIQSVYNEAYLNPKIDGYRELLSNAIATDPFYLGSVPSDYGYKFKDWSNSFSQSINDGHTDFGIKPFIADRKISAIAQFVLAVEEAHKAPNFLAYPNPARHGQQLTIKTSEHELQIDLYNASGKHIKFQTLFGAGTHAVSLKGLNRGMYLIVFKTPSASGFQKIMIE
jgi:spore coat protein CotH